MHRIPITDGVGEWFDADQATLWKEDTYVDGQGNRVSCATGSRWVHEHLYRTRKGTYVLYEWDDETNGENYSVVTQTQAADWLLKNTEEVPEELLGLLEEHEI